MTSTSVVIPVKDGGALLAEVVSAVAGQAPDEFVVIDSGSSDDSVAIARSAGADVIEIAPGDFGHGRTRNLAISRTTGDVIVFLTQDATPVPGWLAAHVEALGQDERVGAAFGPHLPRSATSPMIARELTQFFAPFSPDGQPVIQRALDEESWHPGFLSNVDAAYRRAAIEAVPFRDVAYAEDQAVARDLFAAGWWKAYHPGAAVLHAHDYPWTEFMRRYFDEYRGLRDTIGHVERIGVRSSFRHVRAQVAGDQAWLDERAVSGAERARWTARSVAHHGGRRVFSALGSHAEQLPAPVQRTLSLERRAGGGKAAATGSADLPPTITQRPRLSQELHEEVSIVAREGAAALLDPVPGQGDRAGLHVAIVIPPFRVGSGGHNSIFQLALGLERRGHSVSIWLHDPTGEQRHDWPGEVRGMIREHFAPLQAPVYKDLARDWFGADVVVATGWQTAFQVLRLPACRARAYLVHDHENEFFATSAEGRWAQQTYRQGMFHICSSPWLEQLVREQYGGDTSLFQFGVDHETYFPRPVTRDRDTVVFYGRAVTARRAVPLGLHALAELKRRRPQTRIMMFGDKQPAPTSFAYEHVGIASHEQLAWLYSQGAAGLVLSMTNYSLVPQEMLACGLPCVDLAGFSAETVFGDDGPVELADFDAGALASAIEHLLDDQANWQRRSDAGLAFVRDHTWDAAAGQVEQGLRQALRTRDQAITH